MASGGGEGGDGLPFIGSIMSLVSHGDIRYEGTLYTIDMPNSTIALSNVRCFGTEGRRKENQVPPSDQVFEYVVFKGSEIKELTVVQPPPAPAAAPPPPPLGFSDPAIVSAGPPPGPPPGAAAPWGAPPPPPAYGAAPGGAPFGSSPWGPPAAPPPAAAPPPPGQPAPAPAPTVAVTPMGGAPNGAPAPPAQRPSSYAHAAGGRGAPPQRGGRGGGRGGHAPPHPHPHQQQHPHHQGGRGGPRGGQQQQQPRPPPVEVPKEAFDFEEALKRFNKDEIVKEAEEEHVAVAPKEGAYVKDDFFDQLSCDTLERLHLQEEGEREDWRAKMAAQRKVDVETFGGMGVSRNRNYRYGRGRGRGYGRGRGGGRGGRGQQMSQPAQ